MAFDQAEYIKKQNEAEAAARAGKSPEPGQPPAKDPVSSVATPPAGDDDDDDRKGKHDPGRSQRRTENRLREQAAEERGRRQQLEELIAKGFTPKAAAEAVKIDEDPEPKREAYATDSEHARALARWEGRQEAKNTLAESKKASEAENEHAQWLETVAEMDKKAAEDIKLIPDFREAQEAAIKAAEDDPSLAFKPADQPTFWALLKQSDVMAFVLHHFAKTPEDLRKMLAASPAEQIRMFSRLEGRVEKLYTAEQAKGDGEKKQETAAERDAKKPKPSETGSPKGGVAPMSDVSPYLPDGKTLNPAWKAKMNEREGLRR